MRLNDFTTVELERLARVLLRRYLDVQTRQGAGASLRSGGTTLPGWTAWRGGYPPPSRSRPRALVVRTPLRRQEYDRGTEPLARLIDELDGYADLRTATGVTTTWVLFWLPGPRREAALRQLLAAASVPIATTHAVSGHTPADAVWLPVNETRSARLRLAGLSGLDRGQRRCDHSSTMPSATRPRSAN